MDMDGVFWVSAFVIAYTYLGYPLLLAAWARLSARPVRKSPIQPDSWPAVSIVVAARNARMASDTLRSMALESALHMPPIVETINSD